MVPGAELISVKLVELVVPRADRGGHSKEYVMGSTSDKVSGVANEAIGNVKQGLGKVIGSEKIQAEGLVQEAKGDAQKTMGETKAGVKDAANTAADVVNGKL